MKPRYKVTGCARFFVFFIIFIPIVYFGAAYFRGEDGMLELKNFFRKITGKEAVETSPRNDRDDVYQSDDLRKELDEAKAEIRALRNVIKEQEKEIEKLKQTGSQ
jgi:hypothetical protein